MKPCFRASRQALKTLIAASRRVSPGRNTTFGVVSALPVRKTGVVVLAAFGGITVYCESKNDDVLTRIPNVERAAESIAFNIYRLQSKLGLPLLEDVQEAIATLESQFGDAFSSNSPLSPRSDAPSVLSMYYLWRSKFQHRSPEFKRNASIRAGQAPLRDKQLLDVLIWMAGISDISYLNTSSEKELHTTLNAYDTIPSSLNGAARPVRTPKFAAEVGQSNPLKISSEKSLDASVANPSWEILHLQSSAQKAVPVHFVAVDHTRRCLIMAVRGTFQLADAVTMAGANLQPVKLGRNAQNCAAHAGIVKSANTLLELHLGTLCRYSWEGYQVRLVGHSYGAAVAATIATFLHEVEPSITAFCFGCPPCVTAQLAEKTRHCATTVLLDDDVIPRLTRHSIFELHNELVETERNLGKLISKDKDRFTTEPWDTILYDWMLAKSAELEKGGVEGKSMTLDIPPEEELLYVPGTLVHLYRSAEDNFGAAVADPQFFRKIELSKTMVTDHLISNVRKAIQKYRDNLS